MPTLAEIGAEMVVWLQVNQATKKKVVGIGKDINEFSQKRLKDLLDAARFQGA